MKRILIVDDEPEVREYLGEILTNSGYNITVAADVKEALDHQVNEEFDLLIMDLQMPRINGKEVIDVIRMKRPSLPILVLSGHVESREDLLKLGATQVMPKPIDMHILLDTVKKLLR